MNLTVQEAVGLIKEFPLRKVDEKFELKKSHPIYYQEQGVMAATGISEAAFVIRGAKSSMEVVWVPFDTEFFFIPCLPKLLKFYFEAISPELAAPMMARTGSVRPYFVEWDYSQV